MCGIVGTSGREEPAVRRALSCSRHRGPDFQDAVQAGGFTLGHARLSIVDPSPASHQPFRAGGTTVSYNGELWNYKALRSELRKKGRRFSTSGDTEVVTVALDEWGVYALERFEGMFAVAWTDGETLWLARDRFGEVPLHFSAVSGIAFASEVKVLAALGGEHVPAACWVPPGCFVRWSPGSGLSIGSYYRLIPAPAPEDPAAVMLQRLRASVQERTLSDVPVCTLLSGGVDSSIVAALLKPHFPKLVCYTAVMDPDSPDLAAARSVAAYLDLELREVLVPPPSQDGLAEVVRCIELPRKAQVEIGWACLHLARAMKRDGFKVTFSGEGADELFASYGFSFHGVRSAGWTEYRRELFLSQHRSNFARCNKIFMAHSVECRLPFLNTALVEAVLGFPKEACWQKSHRKVPLQEAAESLLPRGICWRTKLAFQDGLGLKSEAERVTLGAQRFYAAAFRLAYGSARM